MAQTQTSQVQVSHISLQLMTLTFPGINAIKSIDCILTDFVVWAVTQKKEYIQEYIL